MKKNWREALAALGIKPTKKPAPTALFEVDTADGTKLSFPDINDITELQEGATTSAEDGEYTFQADGKTYKVVIAGGVVTSMEETEAEGGDPSIEMAEGLAEALQAFANEFEAKDAEILELKTEAAATKTAIENLKALMSHGSDETAGKPKDVVVGGRKIDLSKLNKKQ